MPPFITTGWRSDDGMAEKGRIQMKRYKAEVKKSSPSALWKQYRKEDGLEYEGGWPSHVKENWTYGVFFQFVCDLIDEFIGLIDRVEKR